MQKQQQQQGQQQQQQERHARAGSWPPPIEKFPRQAAEHMPHSSSPLLISPEEWLA
ncbi:hypothetical protein LZ32DRAFT_656294 [Colletotrichum eremochloae]|nr:hypothetical protein LZ32DRAFT_656294 [Colletotrichum eremochloae]